MTEAPLVEHAESDVDCRLRGVRLLKPNRVGAALSVAFSALCLSAIVFALAKYGAPHGRHSDFGSFLRVMTFGTFGGLFGGWYFTKLSRKPSDVVGELVASREGIRVGGKLLVRREEIRRAFVWPGEGSAFVRIERTGLLGGSFDLQIASIEDGRALLKALKLDASQDAASFFVTAVSPEHYRKRRIRATFGMTGAIVTAFATGVASAKLHLGAAPMVIAVILCGLMYLSLLAQMIRPAKVIVGADGVLLTWFWQKRFIPIQDIRSAELITNADLNLRSSVSPLVVRLHMVDGSRVDILGSVGSVRTTLRSGFNRFGQMRCDMLVERINEAVAAKGQGSSSARAAWDRDLLRRGALATEAWVAKLRGLSKVTESFREPARALDELWEILEDRLAPPARRGAAAVALATELDEDGRKRIRAAAKATVAPQLRMVLDAVASNDEPKMVAALDELAEEEASEVERAGVESQASR
ncbi:MAG: hypothetical protein U0271_10630 [Polyangiaceae bacterium]